MRQVCTIGLDIAKNKFRVHGKDKHGKKMFNKQLSRSGVFPFFANLPACLVGLDATPNAELSLRRAFTPSLRDRSLKRLRKLKCSLL